jgi:putative tricarboxylic transport membrane protein
MNGTRLRQALPYAIGLVAAAMLHYAASGIDYTPRGSELGPDFWPKLAIGVMALVCAVELVRALAGARQAEGIASLLDTGDDEPAGHLHLLLAGVALLGAYAVLLPILGFLLGTMLFMAAFMYAGRYRHHTAIWSVSVAATLIAAFLFLRLAYVSLPRGVPPFDRFTDLLRALVGA